MYIVYRASGKKCYKMTDSPVSFNFLMDKFFLGMQLPERIEELPPGESATIPIWTGKKKVNNKEYNQYTYYEVISVGN
jgi:hypothetical protein